MEHKIVTPHVGKKIERIRTWKRITQEKLAKDIGTSRQTIIKLEQSENIDDERLSLIADALGVSIDDIRNFNEDATISYIQNNYEGSIKDANNFFVSTNNYCTFNALEKYLETIEENKKLYEQLLKSEREKVEILQRQLDKK